MDASADHDALLNPTCLGRFTRAFVQTTAGEIEARLSDNGNWELRVRRDDTTSWRLACRGDLDCDAVHAQPVIPAGEEIMRFGPLSIEPLTRRAFVGQTAVDLAKKEFALLLTLASQPHRVFTKDELIETVWGQQMGRARTRTLDSHASRVRSRLRAAGADSFVINTWGVGYKLWDRSDLAVSRPLRPLAEAA